MTVKKFKGDIYWKVYGKLQKNKNPDEHPKRWQIKPDNTWLGDKIDHFFFLYWNALFKLFFSLFLSCLLSLTGERHLKMKKKCNSLIRKGGWHLKMELGKEGQKETLNPIHQCSSLVQNDSNCFSTVLYRNVQRSHSF